MYIRKAIGYANYEKYVWYDMDEYFFILVNTEAEAVAYTRDPLWSSEIAQDSRFHYVWGNQSAW